MKAYIPSRYLQEPSSRSILQLVAMRFLDIDVFLALPQLIKKTYLVTKFDYAALVNVLSLRHISQSFTRYWVKSFAMWISILKFYKAPD